jgi:hypothetical protein
LGRRIENTEPGGESTDREISLIDDPAFHISQTRCRSSGGSPGRPILAIVHLHHKLLGVALTV